jgi:hypothetical protein
MHWQLILEEFSPELIYLKGDTNIVADALSRLELLPSAPTPHIMHDTHYLAYHFGLDDNDLPADAFPLQYKSIAQHQNLQKDLFQKLTSNSNTYHLKSFCGGGKKRTLICHNDKIVIPTTLQQSVVSWFHNIPIRYYAILVKLEQNRLFDNSFGGQTYANTSMTYAQNATHANELSALQRNMGIYLQRKLKLTLGKSYVSTLSDLTLLNVEAKRTSCYGASP